jgi:hypothetical protein
MWARVKPAPPPTLSPAAMSRLKVDRIETAPEVVALLGHASLMLESVPAAVRAKVTNEAERDRRWEAEKTYNRFWASFADRVLNPYSYRYEPVMFLASLTAWVANRDAEWRTPYPPAPELLAEASAVDWTQPARLPVHIPTIKRGPMNTSLKNPIRSAIVQTMAQALHWSRFGLSL